VITQFSDDKIQVLYADDFSKPDFNEILDKVYELTFQYNPVKIFVDGANPSFIRSLKLKLGEDPDYEKCIDRYRSMKIDYAENMRVAINFAQMHKEMLSHTKMLLEDGFIEISYLAHTSQNAPWGAM
jgi:hypothetical protein